MQSLPINLGNSSYDLSIIGDMVRVERMTPAHGKPREFYLYEWPIQQDGYWHFHNIMRLLMHYNETPGTPFQIPTPDGAPNLLHIMPRPCIDAYPDDLHAHLFDEPENPGKPDDSLIGAVSPEHLDTPLTSWEIEQLDIAAAKRLSGEQAEHVYTSDDVTNISFDAEGNLIFHVQPKGGR